MGKICEIINNHSYFNKDCLIVFQIDIFQKSVFISCMLLFIGVEPPPPPQPLELCSHASMLL